MTFAQFSRAAALSRREIYRAIYAEHGPSIKVKKEKTALKNLELIFEATLKISNRKGFRAMTMRDLSQETGLSLGVLYHYFASKDELLDMVQRTGRSIAGRILREAAARENEPAARLRAVIQTHLFLSEAMQPWFYFSYMEVRHLGDPEKDRTKAAELWSEKLLADIISEGQAAGVFAPVDVSLLSAAIKAMLQDWYVKRGKYAKRGYTVDQYANFMVGLVERFCLVGSKQAAPRQGS
ncbi:MAG: TetR family transcriptional regulator [Desulfarculus sp.]|jgi:AcrR family transcriptional regulator|nr:MAG: TetR family transcriptional regulator [Desulfarculus sp.]